MPQDSSDPLKIDSVGGTTVNQAFPGTGASVGSADTLGFSLGYFITDSLATKPSSAFRRSSTSRWRQPQPVRQGWLCTPVEPGAAS
jgi:outer membrane protein W